MRHVYTRYLKKAFENENPIRDITFFDEDDYVRARIEFTHTVSDKSENARFLEVVYLKEAFDNAVYAERAAKDVVEMVRTKFRKYRMQKN
jgi:hypothetical protein